jgi:hypothetical protein
MNSYYGWMHRFWVAPVKVWYAIYLDCLRCIDAALAMLHCCRHWSPHLILYIASPACTDSSKARSRAWWAVAASVHAANTIPKHSLYHVGGPFLLNRQGTADDCLQSNFGNTCTWSAWLETTYHSICQPWWELSTRFFGQWAQSPTSWRYPTIINQLKCTDIPSSIAPNDIFWVTTKVGYSPLLPSQQKTSVWEQDSVLTRLLAHNCFLPDEREGQNGVEDSMMLTARLCWIRRAE